MTKKKTVNKTLSQTARHHARRILVPHKSNDFRPHIIRAHGIIAVLVVALAAQVAYNFATTGRFEILGRVSDIRTEELLEDTNKQREKEGESALVMNDALSDAAKLKAQDMFTNDYWAHTSPSGVTPWKWLGDTGYEYSVAGENLAKNYPTASATVDAWMASESHKDNILNNKYTDVGFAVVDGTLDGRETTLVVAYYGAPLSAIATGQPPVSPEFSAPGATGATNPASYFASAIQSLSPVTIMILGLLGLVAVIGATAHHYRDKLPKAWKRSWRLHHGMYTFWGMIVLGVLIIIATGGGQI